MNGTRKRIGALGVLALATLMIAGGATQSAVGGSPAAKRANTDTYKLKGPMVGGGKVTIFMHVKKRNGEWEADYVGAMFASEMTYNCDEGPLTGRGFSTQADINVNSSGKFTYNFQSFEAQFTGKVTRHGKKAVGTVSFGPTDQTVNGNEYTNCVLPGSPVQYTAQK